MYVMPSSNKVAVKMLEIFLSELEGLRRKPKLSRQELKDMQRLRKALQIVGGKK